MPSKTGLSSDTDLEKAQEKQSTVDEGCRVLEQNSERTGILAQMDGWPEVVLIASRLPEFFVSHA